MRDLQYKTITDILLWNVNERPDQEFIIYPSCGIRWTFKEFYEICRKAARGMMALGVKKGDHVAIWATNVPEWLIIQFSTALMGAVMVTVNTAYKIYELEYLLKQSDSTTLVMIDSFKGYSYVDCINELCPTLKDSEPGKLEDPNLPYLKNVIFAGDTPSKGMLAFSDLYTLAEQVPDSVLDEAIAATTPDDVVNMQYTSGTTGFPKGVMLTHYNIVNNGQFIGDCMKFSPADRLCITVPLFHCFGCVLGVMACVTHGTSMCMVEVYHPVKVMEAVQNEHCTALHGVPTMFIAILEHERFHEFSFPGLRTGIMAGSPCPIRVMRQVIEEMGMREITISYGQTESSPVVTQTTTDDPLEARVNTVGRTLPHTEVKIVDPETGADMPYDTVGEIVIRGYCVMKGYYKMPEATRAAIDENGWLHSGDLGTMDKNGYFKITGRLKDMIIRGGENIYPRELEEFLYTHPSVKDVQVIGVPDIKYGEEVMACVILKEGESVTAEELIQYTKEKLSRFKAPRYVWFMDSFPMTASGKIQKYKMRTMAVEQWGLQDAAAVETA